MNKKVLAIVSSPRKNGNSELLVDEFIKGAQEAGQEVEKVCLRERKFLPVWHVKPVCVTAALVYRKMIWQMCCKN